jgi:hypothetical protein
MLEVLAGAMGAAAQCGVSFKKGDALLERYVEGSMALLRAADYTPEDIAEAWRKHFKGL